MPEEFPSRAGAFGRWWRIYDEVLDPRVVRQSTPVSCHSACGEMLSDGRITQAQLLEVLGEGMKTPQQVFETLDSFQVGHYRSRLFEPETQYEILLYARFMAFVYAADQGNLHAVVVEVNSSGRLTVLDPWDGTKYDVLEKDFFDTMWSGMAIWKVE